MISYGDRSDKLANGRDYMAMFHMPFCNPDQEPVLSDLKLIAGGTVFVMGSSKVL